MHKIGVRDLVGFILRSGDLSSSLSSMNTAQTGTRIHQQLQHHRSEDYQSEYYLDKKVKIKNHEFLVHGRADGVILNDKLAEIEEIKTSDIEFDNIPQNKLTLYWGQAKVYAYMLMIANPKVKKVTMHLTYVQTPDEKITKDQKDISLQEATNFFQALVTEYSEWLQLKDDLANERKASAKKLSFPFSSYRRGQRELAAAVYKAASFNKHLFAEAPTGTGKTISTLFPAIKIMANDKIKRIFYLTAKQSTRHVAEQAISLMSKKGLRLRSITLTAKGKIKFPEEIDISPEENPYMVGYYDRLKPALKDLLVNNYQITRSVIERYARKYKLDPFEFSLDVSLFCDVIIGDYNYLFDPQVHLQRFFEVEHRENFFLIDESHNLVDRSREMYSVSLNSKPINEIIKLLHKNNSNDKPVLTKLRSLKRAFKATAKPLKDGNLTEISSAEIDDKFTKAVTNLVKALRKWLAKQDPSPKTEQVLDYFFKCTAYLKISDYFDENFKFRILVNEDNITVRLFCMDPSAYIADSLCLGGGAVLFSATLSPMDYYAKILGDEEDSLKYQLPSPFDANNQKVIITSYISTQYKHRDASVAKITDSIYELITGKKGNYLIFAPSNAYLKKCYEDFTKKYPSISTIKQTNNMDEPQRNHFLHAFENYKTKPVVGFALLGGIFSEGIDLLGDKLIGVGIISVGLPGLNTETDLIRNYFDKDNGNGFEYAYQLPGLNNVFQAAGRLIRSNHDQGIILLMDQRFAQKRYTELFPTTWKNYQVVHNLNELKKETHDFWNKH